MLSLVLIINLVGAAIALMNYFTLIRPKHSEVITESIAVLLPVRNEIGNIDRILNELTSQQNLSDLCIYVVNDHSTDGTSEFLRSYSHPTVHVVDAPALPAGWLGKPHALHAGYLAAALHAHDIFITVDADVHFAPDALSSAVASMGSFDFISPYPRQIAVSGAERLIQPLLQWTWMSSVFVRVASKFSLPSTAIANGQFFIVRASVMTTLNGFTTIASSVLDDIQFAKNALRAGFKGSVIEGSTIAQTRMYTSLREIESGYGKSLYPTFKGAGSLALALFIFATSVLPFFFIATPLGFLSVIAVFMTRIISALSSRNSLRDVVAHPLAALLFIWLLEYSYRHRGQITWKGRAV